MDSLYLEKLINDFFMRVEVKDIEISSEANLERKLACYIEDNIPNDFKLETQKNIIDFGIDKIINVEKSEIDITIYNKNLDIKYAIEIKYLSRSDGYTNTMLNYIEDIHFMERLKDYGFTNTYALLVTDNSLYYSNINDKTGRNLKIDGIQGYFRNENLIHGPIENYDIHGSYNIKWKDCKNMKYYLGKMNN